jgi:hypothetical protein
MFIEILLPQTHAAMLVSVGMMGFVLNQPKLTPSENHQAVIDELNRVSGVRRSYFGAAGCPSGARSDFSRRDAKVMAATIYAAFLQSCWSADR